MKTDWHDEDDDCGGPFQGTKHAHGVEDQADEPVTGEIVDQLPAAVPAGPAPVAAGTFAIYPTPDGGFMLVIDRGEGIERRHIPGGLVKLVTRGPMAKAFGKAFG